MPTSESGDAPPVHYVGLAGYACQDVHREAHVKTKTCPDCNGDGVIEKGTDDERQTCGGSGFVPDDDDDEEVTRTASW